MYLRPIVMNQNTTFSPNAGPALVAVALVKLELGLLLIRAGGV